MSLFLKPPQVCFILSSVTLAATEMVNEVLDGANKVGTMGMQALMSLMLAVIGAGLWYSERNRTAERKARDAEQSEQYRNLLAHHETFAKNAELERSGFHLEMKAHAAELRGLTERSILAMHAMATSTDALREYLGARRIGESDQSYAIRDSANRSKLEKELRG